MTDLAPALTTCNAQVKVASKLHICELLLGHLSTTDNMHRDGEFCWKDVPW